MRKILKIKQIVKLSLRGPLHLNELKFSPSSNFIASSVFLRYMNTLNHVGKKNILTRAEIIKPFAVYLYARIC